MNPSSFSYFGVRAYSSTGWGGYAAPYNGRDDDIYDQSTIGLRKQTTSPDQDWGLGINLGADYVIKTVRLDNVDDGSPSGNEQEKMVKVLVRLYDDGTLVYSSQPLQYAATEFNDFAIPNVTADEIRLVVPNSV